MNRTSKQTIFFAEFELDASRRRLLRSGKPVSLQAKAFDVLVYLAENAGRVVSKQEILDAVWEDQLVEEANLAVQVSALRRVLGEQRDKPRFLVTIPGRGYEFIADLHTEEEIIVESRKLSRVVIDAETSYDGIPGGDAVLQPAQQVSPQISDYPNLRFRASLALAGLAFLLATGFGGYWLVNKFRLNGGSFFAAAKNKQAKIKRLTTRGNVLTAILSPDAKFFSYSLNQRGSYKGSLWLGQVQGENDIDFHLSEDFRYYPRAFSTDGEFLYYTASKPRVFTGTLYKISLLGGAPQELMSDVSVYSVLSPDQTQIAFFRETENKTSSLVVANLDETGERELLENPLGQTVRTSLAWSADGRSIAFAGAGAKNGGSEVFITDLADGGIKQVTALQWNDITSLEWLKDNTGLLAVARDRESIRDNQLWTIDRATGKADKLTATSLEWYGFSISLSADSKSLLAMPIESETNVWVAPAENLAAARPITFGSEGRFDGLNGLDWTPDGHIVYAALIGQSSIIWTMDADGGNIRQLTSAGFQDEQPAVTADGSFIVFQSNRSGKTEIWRMGTDGSNPRQLTVDAGNTYPHSTPDGRWVIYSHFLAGETSIWRVPIEGGESVRITKSDFAYPRVSPDGRSIACSYSEGGKERLAIVPADGSSPVKLLEVPATANFRNGIRWLPDGETVAYRDWVNGIWEQSLAGGEPRLLANMPEEKVYSFDWSLDGKEFCFTHGREIRDAVVISDFR